MGSFLLTSPSLEETVMNTRTNKSVMMVLMALAIGMFFAPGALAGMAYNESDYPVYFEKTMDKLHVLHQKVFDQSVALGEREKAKREFFKQSQNLVKKMHARVMALNLKEGAALSHTEVLLSTHLQLMVMDMLSSLQQEAWIDPTGL